MTSLELITIRDLEKLELNEPDAQNTWVPTPVVMVDTSASLKSLVDTLTPLEKIFGSIYMDLEGVNLSRHGSISLIQILIPSCEQAFIVDVHALGMAAFDTPGSEGKSLKDALESENIRKHLFDVRNDSDALYALFGVRLAGVVDVQLLELASRRGPKHVVCGLAKCIEQEQALPSLALSQFQSTKKDVVRMFDPKFGGTYEVFNARPLPQILIDYCVGDVEFLPLLSTIYQSRMNDHWSEKARVETEKRLQESRSPSYEPKGRQKSLGPRRWRFPPKEWKAPTATVAPASKRGEKPAAASTSKRVNKPVTTAAIVVPRKGKDPVAAPTPRKREDSTAQATASAHKRGADQGGKPAAAPKPKKDVLVPIPTPKKGKKSTATSTASATCVPVPPESQKDLVQPAVCNVLAFGLVFY